ncbi:MAG: hypothetical protein P4M04_10600 [Acidobacteriota bacterium]|nr:hypothetical protein [Acidobacteriota bacterium]
MKKFLLVECLITAGVLLAACSPAAAQVLHDGTSWGVALYAPQSAFAVRYLGDSPTLCDSCNYEGDSNLYAEDGNSSEAAGIPTLKLGTFESEDGSPTARSSDPLDFYDWSMPASSPAVSSGRLSNAHGVRVQAYTPVAAAADPTLFTTDESAGKADMFSEMSSPGTQALMRVNDR